MYVPKNTSNLNCSEHCEDLRLMNAPVIFGRKLKYCTNMNYLLSIEYRTILF